MTLRRSMAEEKSAAFAANKLAAIAGTMPVTRPRRRTAALMQSLHPIAQTVTSPPRVLWRAIVNAPSEKRLQKLETKQRVECPAVFRFSRGALPYSVVPHGVAR